ncbi:MAG: hypothetical protein IPJ97_09195 [Proteobacteria bacterium]|nr:hypothetical protein [Pseudomonadota bacterium]
MYRLFSAVAVAGAMALCAPTTQAQEASSGDWKQTVFFYGMGAAIEGDAQIGNVAVPIDLSISNLFDALKFGAMAAYRIENDEWSFTGDVTYMNLGWSGQTQQGRASSGIDVEQLTLMGTVGRRISPHLEGLVSLGYFDLSTDLRVRVLQQRTEASRDASWVDPLVGLNYVVPIGAKWTYTLAGTWGDSASAPTSPAHDHDL